VDACVHGARGRSGQDGGAPLGRGVGWRATTPDRPGESESRALGSDWASNAAGRLFKGPP